MPVGNLPPKAKRMWEHVYQSAKGPDCDEECAARQAWAAVKKKYKKVGDKWVAKSNAEVVEATQSIGRKYTQEEAGFRKGAGVRGLQCGECANFISEGKGCAIVEGDVDVGDVCHFYEQASHIGDMGSLYAVSKTFDMFITKASQDPETGERRWAAVASDDDRDSYGDRMTVELFQDFISRIKRNETAPAVFTSDAWQGGMPYLGLAHYLDLNGEAIVGDPDAIYIDGNRLKAKGVFRSTPLGEAAFKAIKRDIKEGVPPNKRIRISIAFVDWAHKHGEDGEVFVRESLSDSCPQCVAGKGEKVFLKGQLVHLALTRVPVNERTPITLEERSMVTRKEDALDVLGEEHKDLVEEIDRKSKHGVMRSEAVVIKSDEFGDYDESYVEKRKFSSEKREKLAKEGKALPDGSFPIENCSDVENAIQAIGRAKNPSKAKAHIKKRAKALGCSEKIPDNWKSEATEEEVLVEESLGGATDLDAAEEWLKQQEKVYEIWDTFYLVENVMINIAQADSEAIPDKPAAIGRVIQQFKDRVDDVVKRSLAKRAAQLILESEAEEGEPMEDKVKKEEREEEEPQVKKSETQAETPVAESPLDAAFSQLRSAIEEATKMPGASMEDKARIVQPALNSLAEVVKSAVKGETEAQAEAIATAVGQAVAAQLAPLTEAIQLMAQKSVASPKSEEVMIPGPRAYQPPPFIGRSDTDEKPKSKITELARRTVGLK